MATWSLSIAVAAQQYAWSTPVEYFPYGTVPGDSATCCGSAIIGNPKYGEPQYTCLCDLTILACDDGCCCDPDCSGFQSLKVFQCVSNATVVVENRVRLCSDQLSSVNLPKAAIAAGYNTLGLDGLLCVVKDNSIAQGYFLTDPVADRTLTPAEIAQEIAYYSPTTFTTWLEPTKSAPRIAAYYTLDEPLLGDSCLSSEGQVGCAEATPIIFPARDNDGSCNGAQQVPFLRDIVPFNCELNAPLTSLINIAAACTGILNTSFLASFLISATPSASVHWVRPSLFVNTNGSSVYNAINQVPQSNLSGDCCIGAMTGYQLRVIVNSGVVQSAAAYITTADVCTGQLAAIALSYGLAFEDANAQASRATSGRPGYQQGLPLLIADGSLSRLTLRADGFSMLPTGPAGVCQPAGLSILKMSHVCP